MKLASSYRNHNFSFKLSKSRFQEATRKEAPSFWVVMARIDRTRRLRMWISEEVLGLKERLMSSLALAWFLKGGRNDKCRKGHNGGRWNEYFIVINVNNLKSQGMTVETSCWDLTRDWERERTKLSRALMHRVLPLPEHQLPACNHNSQLKSRVGWAISRTRADERRQQQAGLFWRMLLLIYLRPGQELLP